MLEKIYLGIDVGSVSTNIVAIDEENNLISKSYMRTEGQPIETVKQGIQALKKELDGKYEVAGVGATGSGRQLAGILVGADVVKNEITAHATAAVNAVPEVRTILKSEAGLKIIF